MAAGAKDRWADTQINAQKKLLKTSKKNNVFLFQFINEKGAGGKESSVYKMTRNDKYLVQLYIPKSKY